MSDLVFVYGTLKKGFCNNSVLQQSNGRFIKEWSTKPCFTMVDLEFFPGVIKKGNTCIKGEVWKVDDLSLLDCLEGHPNFYERTQLSIGEEEKAWIYLLPYEEYRTTPVIESGEWKEAA